MRTKVTTFVGTRPEIIRLACIIEKFDLLFGPVINSSLNTWTIDFAKQIYTDRLMICMIIVIAIAIIVIIALAIAGKTPKAMRNTV